MDIGGKWVFFALILFQYLHIEIFTRIMPALAG